MRSHIKSNLFFFIGGNWGPDCSKACPCKNGGRCEPHTGQCLCAPGWKGLHCQNKCGEGAYGLDCAQTCECSVGQRCHHVSGECLPCTSGNFFITSFWRDHITTAKSRGDYDWFTTFS